MFSSLLDLFKQFTDLFVWWTVIQPWEQGIRVRLGKHRTRLTPGLHVKIPHLDLIYRQTTRRRYTQFGPNTVTTRDGHTITIAGAVGYSIKDLDKLYNGLQHPEDSLHAMVSGRVSEYITTHDLADCTPEMIVSRVRPHLGLTKFGLRNEHFVLNTYARVKTYRLIMDQHPGTWGDALETNSTKA
jgi:hypothetical protein